MLRPSFPKIALLGLILPLAVSAVTPSESLQNGKDYYFAGEFKKAITHFQRTIKAYPNDPEPYLWLGKSYAVLADLNAPVLGARARAQARLCLAKAVQLAPESPEYRRELFDFLVGSDDAWFAGRDAEALLRRMPASEAEDPERQFRLRQKRQEHSSPEAIAGKLLVWAPETLVRWTGRPCGIGDCQ
jgi:Flp pilus assembly protein TadD